MGVRLLLVSVVAGLGLTLPSMDQVKTWTESAQTWVYARLAEVDSRMPADQGDYVYITDGPPVPAEEPPVYPAVETTAIETALTSDTPAAKSTTAQSDAQAVPANESKTSIATVSEGDFPAASELAELIETPRAPAVENEPELSPAPVAVAVHVISDEAFEKAQKFVIDGFVSDLKRHATEALVAKTVVAPAPVDPVTWDVKSFDESPSSTFVSSAFSGVPEAPAPPVFEPIAVQDDSSENLALALNREAEGLTADSARAPLATRIAPMRNVEDLRPVSGGRTTQLVHAVRLTREAVYAWANLLHGPAVVTIAH